MDLIDREQLMNYIRSRKINIGKLAHDVIMKQPSIQPQKPCEDTISRKEVLNQIFYSTDNSGDVVLGSVLRHRIENLTSVKPQEPFDIETYCKEHFCVMVDKDVWEKSEKALKQEKVGYWILADEQNKADVENDNYRFICSECQCSDIHAKGTIVPYCWKCGARMESEGDEE